MTEISTTVAPVIERMRVAQVAEEQRWTAAQLRTIIDGCSAGMTLPTMVELTGRSADDIKSLIGDKGTWVTHVLGGCKVPVRTSDDAGVLFDAVPKPRQRRGKTEPVVLESITLPRGFEVGPDRRNVSKALGALVYHATLGSIDDEIIARYLARRYPARTRVLTYSMLSVVWKFAELGRIDDLERLNPSNPVLSELLVAGYDLLELARRDALTGLAALCQAAEPFDASTVRALRSAAAKARWLAEGDIRQIEKALAIVESRPASAQVLTRALRSFGMRVASNPSSFALTDIGQLNEGQVRRIAEMTGLAVENDRDAEKDIRKRLSDMGLASDADLLIPQGVRATQAGAGDAFWLAMQARAKQDPEWASILEDALGELDSELVRRA